MSTEPPDPCPAFPPQAMAIPQTPPLSHHVPPEDRLPSLIPTRSPARLCTPPLYHVNDSPSRGRGHHPTIPSLPHLIGAAWRRSERHFPGWPRRDCAESFHMSRVRVGDGPSRAGYVGTACAAQGMWQPLAEPNSVDSGSLAWIRGGDPSAMGHRGRVLQGR